VADVQSIYNKRFGNTGLEKRDRVWKILCDAYFSKLVPSDATVLDLACGYGEFINNIKAKKKYAVDLNADSPKHLKQDVIFKNSVATDLSFIGANNIDVAFTSNFLEHLKDKNECDQVLKSILNILRPGGRFIILGPNIKYAYREYWDYYDHYLPLSHLSLAEGLILNGYEIVSVIDRFLPYTMNNNAPTHDAVIRAYLAFPLIWRFFGKQFLIIARKPKR
jgi:SAM-dependent methyltransferase